MIQFLASTRPGRCQVLSRDLRLRIAALSAMTVAVLTAHALCIPVAKADSASRPNIVLILADDKYQEFSMTSHPYQEIR